MTIFDEPLSWNSDYKQSLHNMLIGYNVRLDGVYISTHKEKFTRSSKIKFRYGDDDYLYETTILDKDTEKVGSLLETIRNIYESDLYYSHLSEEKKVALRLIL